MKIREPRKKGHPLKRCIQNACMQIHADKTLTQDQSSAYRLAYNLALPPAMDRMNSIKWAKHVHYDQFEWSVLKQHYQVGSVDELKAALVWEVFWQDMWHHAFTTGGM